VKGNGGERSRPISHEPVSRRGVLLGGIAGLGTGLLAGSLTDGAAAATALTPYSMAMHLHTCYSEGTASMQSHLQQAALNGVDVVWWTDHDFRMLATGYRQAVHLTSAKELENGLAWTWSRTTAGSPATAVATWVTSPVSPADPVPGALHLVTTGTTGAWSTQTMTGSAANSLIRTGIAGQRLTLDVLATSLGPDAYVELSIGLSHRPDSGGRPGGRYTIAYRVGGPNPPGSAVPSGISGVVTVAPATSGWTTITTDLVDDVKRLWPDLVPEDHSTYQIKIVTGARSGASADVVVDYLRFDRAGRTGPEALASQQSIMDAHAAAYPSVQQHAATELSLYLQHLGYYGGTLVLPDISGMPVTGDPTAAALLSAVQHIHGNGALASYNHPFGSSDVALLSAADQTAARRALAKALLGRRAYGADLLEVGYPARGGVSLANHVQLWDTLSRNGLFLTGSGVSDDHTGTNWLSQKLNFLTWVWAGDTGLGALTDALAAGRAWFGNPKAFRGQLDLLVDGAVPMGSVTATAAGTCTVRIIATDLPTGARLQLIRGVVDYAGADQPDPITTVVKDVPAPASGYVDVTVDTSTACFIRAVVRDRTSAAIAFGNPVWLLRQLPPGVPPARLH